MNQLFTSLAMLCVILFAGCSHDEGTPEFYQKPELITYSATYTVSEISDDFFDLGSFIVSYADKDAEKQVMDLGKAQMPFTVTVKDLKEDSNLSFDLLYGYFTDIELTKEKYTFKMDVSLTIKGSNGSMYSSTIKNGSIAIGKEKVKIYLDQVTMEEQFESTVKQFISKE